MILVMSQVGRKLQFHLLSVAIKVRVQVLCAFLFPTDTKSMTTHTVPCDSAERIVIKFTVIKTHWHLFQNVYLAKYNP